MQRLLALILLLIISPIFVILYIIVKATSKGPYIFKQKRSGKNKKIFMMYKIRTMVENAEKLKAKYQHLNEVDGPVFKIRDDPRYTRIGKLLSRFAIDELTQLINIIKGEMSFVGPRPLPVDEANRVPKKYEARFAVLPGMTSLWIIKGAHRLNFEEWMNLDLEYVKRKSLWYDSSIFCQTLFLLLKIRV